MNNKFCVILDEIKRDEADILLLNLNFFFFMIMFCLNCFVYFSSQWADASLIKND